MKKARGVIPPLVTPFTENGELDEKSLIRVVDFLTEHVHGLFVCGSYGNGPLMNPEERKRVAEIVSENIPADIQFIVHVGSTTVRDSVELARHAEKKGADKIASVVPYYYHHTQESIKLHFEKLLEAVDIPIYVYNNPKYTGTEIDIDFLNELSQLGASGVKDSSFDIMVLDQFIRKKKDEDFDVVLGTEAMFLPAFSLGVRAFIPGLGNAFPALCTELFESAVQGDLERARKLQKRVNEVRDIMYLTKSTVVAVYNMLKIRGICRAFPRQPFTQLSQREIDELEGRLKDIDVI